MDKYKTRQTTLINSYFIYLLNTFKRGMTKSEDPGKYYNKRVSECRIAAQVFFFPIFYFFNPLRARIFTDFGLWSLLEGRVLHKGAWIATLLGTLLGVQDYKKVRFPGRDISSLAVKGLISHKSLKEER